MSRFGYVIVRAPGHYPFAFRAAETWFAHHTYTYNITLNSVDSPLALWAGLRNSFYGATGPEYQWAIDEGADVDSAEDGTASYPPNEQWGTALAKIVSDLPGAAPTMLLAVGEIFQPTGDAILWFYPLPGTPAYDHIKYELRPGYDLDSILQYCNARNIRVYLQVEPAYANVMELMDVVMKRFGANPSVAGFGVDVEWNNNVTECAPNDDDECSPCNGQQVTDAVARDWESHLYSLIPSQYNPTWQLILKHFTTNSCKMPPNWRGNIIFVDDTQDDGSKAALLDDWKGWVDNFAPNDVWFQQGYKPDYKSTWSTYANPVQGFGADVFAQGQSGQQMGFIWVDFTMRHTSLGLGFPPFGLKYCDYGGISHRPGETVTRKEGKCISTPHGPEGEITTIVQRCDWYSATYDFRWNEISRDVFNCSGEPILSWKVDQEYAVGDLVTYQGDVYECTYYHISQLGWEPDNPTLWAVWKTL